MSDLAYSAMTDAQLAAQMEHAQFCLVMAQTPEQRARYMAATDEIKQEQERRGGA